MAQKRSYSRYFIILQEDEKGYGIASDKQPSGYVKLEVKNDKCKVSYYVQNLKKEMQPYHLILICNKKDTKKLIKIGSMNIDDNGRMETSFEFPPDDIAGTKLTSDMISGAAVVKFVDTSIIDVMSGFIGNTESGWKAFTVMEGKEAPKDMRNEFDNYEKTVKEDAEKEKPEIDKEIKRPEKDVPKKAKETVKEKKEPLKEVAKEVKKEAGKQVQETVKKDAVPVEAKIKEERIPDVNVNENLSRDEPNCGCEKNKLNEFFRNLTSEFEEIHDCDYRIKGCKWHKINVNSMKDLSDTSDYNKYTILYYPMISHYCYIKKYRHFIFGCKYDKDNKIKYIVYGIPGTRDYVEQPFGGRYGFVTWVPMKNRDDLGYWLAFYDFRKSTIIIPVK